MFTVKKRLLLRGCFLVQVSIKAYQLLFYSEVVQYQKPIHNKKNEWKVSVEIYTKSFGDLEKPQPSLS